VPHCPHTAGAVHDGLRGSRGVDDCDCDCLSAAAAERWQWRRFPAALPTTGIGFNTSGRGGCGLCGRAPTCHACPSTRGLLSLHHCIFFLIHRSHSISFTRAQGIPKYKIGFGIVSKMGWGYWHGGWRVGAHATVMSPRSGLAEPYAHIWRFVLNWQTADGCPARFGTPLWTQTTAVLSHPSASMLAVLPANTNT
jgi:hypothetical protein